VSQLRPFEHAFKGGNATPYYTLRGVDDAPSLTGLPPTHIGPGPSSRMAGEREPTRREVNNLCQFT